MSHPFKVAEDCIERPLMSLIIILLVFILLEFAIVFIDGIVSQVHI